VGRRLLEALSVAVPIEGRELVVPASIGLAVLPPGESLAVDELLRRADVAMYRAKAAGKQQMATYAPTMDAAPAADTGPLVSHTRTPRSGAAAPLRASPPRA
jgi:predicted signal transduction protein with EAL and GGDEF domain